MRAACKDLMHLNSQVIEKMQWWHDEMHQWSCGGRCLLPEPTIVDLSFFILTPNRIKTFDLQGQAGTVSIRPDALIPCCSKYIIIVLSCSFPPPMRALIPGSHTGPGDHLGEMPDGRDDRCIKLRLGRMVETLWLDRQAQG